MSDLETKKENTENVENVENAEVVEPQPVVIEQVPEADKFAQCFTLKVNVRVEGKDDDNS